MLQLFVPVCTHFWIHHLGFAGVDLASAVFLSSISVREVSTPRVAIPFGPISDPGASSSSSASSSDVSLALRVRCDGDNLSLNVDRLRFSLEPILFLHFLGADI